MATVRHVARRAGVSVSTVSHVLNQSRFVSEELRQRVIAAMRELEFEPNAAARMLSLRRSNTIGLIVSDIRNPFFASVARGVEDVAQECGYTVVQIPVVLLDAEGAAYRAVRHLIDCGHRRIATLSGRRAISTTVERGGRHSNPHSAQPATTADGDLLGQQSHEHWRPARDFERGSDCP